MKSRTFASDRYIGARFRVFCDSRAFFFSSCGLKACRRSTHTSRALLQSILRNDAPSDVPMRLPTRPRQRSSGSKNDRASWFRPLPVIVALLAYRFRTAFVSHYSSSRTPGSSGYATPLAYWMSSAVIARVWGCSRWKKHCTGAPPNLKMGWTSGVLGPVLRIGMSVIAGKVGRTMSNLPARLCMSVRRPARETLRILMGVLGLGGFKCSPMSNI